jgi:hypothetical protein
MPAAARLTLRNWWKLRWARTLPPICAAWWPTNMAIHGAPERMFGCVGKPLRESDGLAPIVSASRTCLLFRPDGEIDDLDPRS